jgi:hypothetical protein
VTSVQRSALPIGTAVAQWLRYCATVRDRGSTVVKVLRNSGGAAVAQWLRYCATVGDRDSTVVKVLRYSVGGPRYTVVTVLRYSKGPR